MLRLRCPALSKGCLLGTPTLDPSLVFRRIRPTKPTQPAVQRSFTEIRSLIGFVSFSFSFPFLDLFVDPTTRIGSAIGAIVQSYPSAYQVSIAKVRTRQHYRLASNCLGCFRLFLPVRLLLQQQKKKKKVHHNQHHYSAFNHLANPNSHSSTFSAQSSGPRSPSGQRQRQQ